MSRDTKSEKTDGGRRSQIDGITESEPLTQLPLLSKAAAIKNTSRVPRYQNREKSTVSAIFRVKPFAKDWKRVWEKVEAPHYSKEGLGWLRKSLCCLRRIYTV